MRKFLAFLPLRLKFHQNLPLPLKNEYFLPVSALEISTISAILCKLGRKWKVSPRMRKLGTLTAQGYWQTFPGGSKPCFQGILIIFEDFQGGHWSFPGGQRNSTKVFQAPLRKSLKKTWNFTFQGGFRFISRGHTDVGNFQGVYEKSSSIPLYGLKME